MDGLIMISTEQRMDEFFTLAARYCELGRLLPSEDDLALDHGEAAIAEAKLVLAEMAKVKAEMDALLERKN
jgi:hypothetical protein